MVSPQRALSKLCEFLPHQQGSTCIQIGKKSGRILVTAGNQTINLWTVGNIASPVLRLPDQPTAVGTLTFDSQEELLAATFQNGVIKVWDLEEAKVVRTLEFFDKELPSLYPTTVAFHPCRSIVAYFLADGSAQVYDLKACRVLQTHHPFSHLSQESNKTTSHSFSSGLIQFSPDGRWLCTAVNSLQTKYHKIHIWDLVASKCIAELQTTGNSPINNVHFNPIDFVLALGTVSGTVELWDLDTFKLSASFPETSSLRTLSFAPDGNVLFALHSSYIKTYRWPPTADQKMNETTIPITEGDGWKDVVDMAAVSRTHHFVVAALPNPNVILWTIDTKKLCAVGDDVVDGVVTKDTDVVEASLQDDHCISEVSNELSREAKRSTPQPDIKQLSEDALAEALLKESYEMCSLLTTRLTNLRAVRSIWTTKASVTSALETLTRINDPSVLHDLISHNIISVTESKLSFDDCLLLLPLLKSLLRNEEVEEYVFSSLKLLKEIVRAFSSIVKARETFDDGHDEETDVKCNMFYEHCFEIKQQLQQMRQPNVKIAQSIREIAKELQTLPSKTF